MVNSNNFIRLKNHQIVTVEASAGSGKTYALAKRYLQLLINRNAFSSDCLGMILAITFTNKATFQMKERILEILKNLALDSFSDQSYKKDIVDSLGVSYDFARRKAYSLIDEIIRNYSFFQVKTIDSFINHLLLGCALHIRRSASFKIKRNYKEYVLYALDLLIERSLSDASLNKDLNNFLGHYLFVENRTGWFPKDQILELMLSFFELVNRYGTGFIGYPVSSSLLLKEKKIIYEMINDLSKKLCPGLNKRSRESILGFVRQKNDHFDIASIPKSFTNPYPPLNKGAEAGKKFIQVWQKIHKRIGHMVELEAEAAYNPYVGIFNRLSGIFDLYLEKEDMLFLNQLNFQAGLLFDRQGITVAEAYYRMAARFSHYLIDEFQDTSRLQWNNLRLMVEDGLASGGTLFYVGDKKQAIYRFRGGQSKLFDKLKNDFSHYQPITLFLSKNWRSQKEIVEFNNFLFSSKNLSRFLKSSKIDQELCRQSHFNEIINNFSAPAQTYKKENNKGYVYLEKLNDKNQNQRNEIVRKKVINLICDLKKRFNLGDIALLARDNQEVELLTTWLLEEGFSPESEKTLNVLEHPLIKEIISFLKFLYSPIDDLSFALFILGSFFQKKSGLSEKEVKDFLFSLRKKEKNESLALYRKFALSFPQIWQDLIAPFFKAVGLLSLYRLLVAVYNCYQLAESFPQAQAFLKKFLQLCQDSQEEKAGLWSFLSYINQPDPDKIYIDVAAENSIKILTIHKAKGLEFPVVIVPFLRMDVSAGDGPKGANFYLDQKADSYLQLLRITKEQKKYSARLNDIYQKSFQRSCIDELNSLYVALTRPKNELYLFIPRKSGNSLNHAWFLVERETLERGKKVKYSSSISESNIEKIEPSFCQDWAGNLYEEVSEPVAGKESRKIKEGIIFHQALSTLGDLSKKNIDKAIKGALTYVKNKNFIKDTGFFQRKLRGIVTAENLKEIFFQPRASIYCELEMVDRRGSTKKIDRILIFKEKVLIVEFKRTRLFAQEALKQLKAYRELAAEIYKGKKIEAVVVYLDRLEKEYLT